MKAISEKSLTPGPKPDKVRLMEDALSILVAQALGKRSIREGAEACGIADYLLRDVILKKTRRPSPDTLRALTNLSRTLTYEKLALAAYGVIHEPDLEHVPALAG